MEEILGGSELTKEVLINAWELIYERSWPEDDLDSNDGNG